MLLSEYFRFSIHRWKYYRMSGFWTDEGLQQLSATSIQATELQEL